MSKAKKIEFPTDEYDRIDAFLENKLRVKGEAARQDFINEIETTGAARVFAGASLLHNPLEGVDVTYDASLKGWKTSFCVKDVFLRGTAEKPSLTIGLDDSDPESEIVGGILEVNLKTSLSKGLNFADRVISFLEEFVERESPPNMPIYAFQLLEAEAEDRQIVRGVACVADKKGPLYVGDKDLTLEEQAVIIATSINEERTEGPYMNVHTIKPGFRTGLDYLRRKTSRSLKEGKPLSEEEKILLEKASEHRQRMHPLERERLEAVEQKDLHEDVYYQVPIVEPDAETVANAQDRQDNIRAKMGDGQI